MVVGLKSAPLKVEINGAVWGHRALYLVRLLNNRSLNFNSKRYLTEFYSQVEYPHPVDSDSSRRQFMDAISALGVAGGILTVTEFSVELLSASDASKVSSSPEEKDETSVLENFRKLRLALSNKLDLLQQRLPTSPSTPLKDELALLELASSLEDSEVLLEAIGSIPKVFLGHRSQPWEADTRAWVESKLAGRFNLEKVKLLSHALTRHASSILT